MALISKRFTDSIQGKANEITPIVILADLNEEESKYEILDSFSTSVLTLYLDNVNTFQTKGILKNISSIKNSIDIENRKLKTNTFRFSLYNYYDVLTSLTNSEKYIQTEDENPLISLIGKYIILYYKSQATTIIDLTQNSTQFDTDTARLCPIVFKGIITRTTINDELVTIQGEDFTQDTLKDKSLPSTKISDLDELIVNNTIEEDKEKPIPMVFGKVDKSPVIVYNTNYTNNEGFKSLGFIHDNTSTGNKFTTSKLLNDFDSAFYIYIKDSDDYLIFPYVTSHYDYLGKTFFVESGTENIAIVPELNESQEQSVYCLGYTYATNAISDLSAGNTSSLDGTVSEDEGINPDYSALLANYGMKRGWYRSGEIINTITDEESFDFGHKTYPISTAKGTGRWILVQLDKKEVLQGFRCYSKLYVDPNDDTAVNDASNNPDNINTVFIKPFNPDQWKTIMESSLPQGSWVFTLYDDDDLPASYIADSDTDATFDKVEDVKQVLSATESVNIRDNLGFFDNVSGNESYSYNLIGAGLTQAKVKADFDGSIPCDRIILWESYQGWGVPTKTIQCGGYMHSFAAKYIKKVEDYSSSEFYASITGRKDYASTEPVGNLAEQFQEVTGTWSDALLGPDGLEPDYEGVLDFWDDYFEKKYLFEGSVRYADEYGGGSDFSSNTYTHHSWFNPLTTLAYELPHWREIGITTNSLPDTSIEYPDLEELGLDDGSLMKSNQIVVLALHGIMKKFHHAALLQTFWNETSMGLYYDGYINTTPQNTMDVKFSIVTSTRAVDAYLAMWEYFKFAEDYLPSFEFAINRIQDKLDELGGHRRALIRRVLQYVYQNEVSNEPELDTIFQNTIEAGMGYTDLDDWGGAEPFDYQWNSPEFNILDSNNIVIPEGWTQHFEMFMNDTVETALYSNGNALLARFYEWQYSANSVKYQYNELHSWNDDPALVGEAYVVLEGYSSFNPIITELYQYISVDSLEIECFAGGIDSVGFSTNGIVTKPIDIIINILSMELNFGLTDAGLPSPDYYNQELIQKQRDFYSSWQMGFCIDKEIDAEKLISDMCKETQSFFTFTPSGSFDLMTIKNKYAYEDIEHFIDETDIIKYKFDKTKREKVITSCNYFYRYDNGQSKYTMETGVLSASSDDLLTGYDGDSFYNLHEETTGYVEKNLRYHTETATAKLFQMFDLLNNCNQHTLVTLELPLKYMDVELGNIIYLPLIKDEKVFGVDYSKVSTLNGQHIYPVWIVTEVDIKLDKIVVKAYQLHHLTSNVGHGFIFPDQGIIDIEVNTNEFHSLYTHNHSVNPEGDPLPNWNYFNVETSGEDGYNYIHNDDLQIPYCDVTGDGIINVQDIVSIVSMILSGTESYSDGEIQRADFGSDGVVNVVDVVKVVDVILGPA